ncbi:mitotic fidelity of chromosome transmission- protein [Saxophila tyrrhenica]|uniref:Mitotic fidelity of chromosome transmission-protein n=1 Tax=Saxophila tyrrhenica TaxID=1690608 RepID=A0AAV9PFD3_9PEZI|nr:mitotic fidelity of chromosome transmission- protein [Saxophila tyrrhenica]
MARVAKKAKGSTPGRPKKKDNQFFDVGKVGRKTGITLEDKGVRDEHGLEPVSHIFSSPGSPSRDHLDSSDAHMHESSGPDVDVTLASRKTPRLPPARASTPKHTNIGSPKRASTGRPAQQRMNTPEEEGTPARVRSQLRPNRVLDFGEGGVKQSIESPSPFKPRHVLRRSLGVGKSNPFASPATSKATPAEVTIAEEDEQEAEGAELPVDDGPLILDDDEDSHDAVPQHDEEEAQTGAAEEEEEEQEVQEVPQKRKSGRPRKSGSSVNSSQIQHTPPVAPMVSSRKRDRSTLENSQLEDASISQSQISQTGRAQKKQRGGRPSLNKVIVHHDEGDEAVDPSVIAHGDEYVVEEDASVPAEEPEEPAPAKQKGNGKKSKAPKERDPNRAMRGQSEQVKLNDSPSKLRDRREGSRSLSVGPISNVHLRAATPYEDAGERTSRYGRNLVQPLKYWANEMRLYKNGETAGIVRADIVSPPKRRKPVKKKTKKKNKGGNDLNDIDEESDAESTHPDEWEEEVGVIAGDVANWDPEKQQGDPEDLVREDLAFASNSIVAKDVANTTFKYAKIMTLPFFGSGLVELPPGGEKRAKNCRKMQMCFFVHEGKVMVEVYPAGRGGDEAGEVTQFAIAKGGVWVVPRGNNYSILNESTTKTARIFFAQGCEVVEMGK